MPNYRRNRVPGGTYFFTVNLLEHKTRLLVDHIDKLLVEAGIYPLDWAEAISRYFAVGVMDDE